MRPQFRIRSFLLVAAAVLTVAAGQAQTTYYPATDAAKDIDAAFAAAKKDGKRVLLDFGADWCPDCRVLGTLFDQPDVAAIADARFHVVRVDVGRRDKNADLVAKYHATSNDWIPAVVVLDANGNAVATTDDKVRLTRKTTPAELAALLQQWAPDTDASFVEKGVRVDLRLDRDARGRLWIAGTFTPTQPETHLYAIDLPDDGIQGLGRPTKIALGADSDWRAIGPLEANRSAIDDPIEALHAVLRIYPDGPVTVRLPVAPRTGAVSNRATVAVSYMACGNLGCLPPVQKRVAIEARATRR
jgi:thiol-disulfide isomerase/thioredoxin